MRMVKKEKQYVDVKDVKKKNGRIDPDVILIGSSSDEAEPDSSDSDSDGVPVTAVPTDVVATQTVDSAEQSCSGQQVPVQSGYPHVIQVHHILHYAQGNYPLPSQSIMTSVSPYLFNMPFHHAPVQYPPHAPVHGLVHPPPHAPPHGLVHPPPHAPPHGLVHPPPHGLVHPPPHAPGHGLVHPPPHGQEHPPPHAPGHGLVHPPPHAPGHGLVHPPPHAPGHGLVHPPPHAPGHGLVHPPPHGQEHPPPHAPGHGLVHPPPHAPGHGLVHPPPHAPGHGLVHPPPHAPGHGLVHPPPHGLVHPPPHAPVHGLVHPPPHAPVHGLVHPPPHAPGHGLVHPPPHAPVHGLVHPPPHAPGHGLVHPPPHGQEHPPPHAPGHGLVHPPPHSPPHAPGHDPVHPPHAPVHSPPHAPGHTPVHPPHAPPHAPVHPPHAPPHGPVHPPCIPHHAPVTPKKAKSKAKSNASAPPASALKAKLNAPSLASVTASIHRRQTTPSGPICIPAQPLHNKRKMKRDDVPHDEPPPTKRNSKKGEVPLQSASKDDALEKEKNVYKQSINNAVKYQSDLTNAFKKLKTLTAAKGGKGVCVQNSRGRIPLKTKMLQGNATLYDGLKEYLLTEQTRIEQGYPFRNTKKRYGAVLKGGDKRIITDSPEKICSRCGATYSVGQTGRHTRMKECNYHYGKGVEQRVPGGVETRYSCCEAVIGSPGCQVFKLHVHDGVSLDGFVATIPRTTKDTSCPGVYSLNCEKCYTTRGVELSRVTLVNSSMQILYDTFVRPANDVIDYNTRFSGISEKNVKDVNVSIKAVQKTLMNLIRADTILIGHSLDMDLCLLKLTHEVVVDTSVVFPHSLGPPHKLALNTLVADHHLQTIVQDSASGHDTAEDALACMELMLWKIKEGGRVRRV